MDSLEYEAYESAVNLQWLKLSGATTSEEIREVLDTWPSPKDYEIKEEQKEDKDDTDEI